MPASNFIFFVSTKKTEAKESDPKRLPVKVNRFDEFPRAGESILRKQELAPLKQLSLSRRINSPLLSGTDGGVKIKIILILIPV